MKNIFIRSITGIIFVTLIVGALIFNPFFSAFFFLVISIIGLFEFYNLLKKTENNPNIYIGIVIGVIVYLINFLSTNNYIHSNWFLSIFPLISLLFIIELYRKKTNPFTNISLTIFGIIYIILPFSLISELNKVFESEIILNKYFVLSIFILIWSSDTFAYITGMSIGKHKLFERISPKKTWEGFFGGLIGTIGISIVLHYFFPQLLLWQWIGLAIIIDISGTFGDLLESLFKRSINIKDSGNILPGHGGILDRFDSFIFAIPFVYVYIKLILT